MFKPSTRSRSRSRTRSFSSARVQPAGGFAETQFLHAEGDEDYSGFAPTQMFDDERAMPRTRDRRAARRDGVPARVAALPGEEHAMPASWVTSRWVEEQEAKAHRAADEARALIAAQRRRHSPLGRGQGDDGVDGARRRPANWLRRLHAAVQRVLPFDLVSVLPLFVCVSLTMALISAVLPLFDKP